jgi:serpin B
VEEQTDNKIRNLIPPGVLNKMTRLVLTNAIYFKGYWDKQFDRKTQKRKILESVQATQLKLK